VNEVEQSKGDEVVASVLPDCLISQSIRGLPIAGTFAPAATSYPLSTHCWLTFLIKMWYLKEKAVSREPESLIDQ